MSRSKRKTPIFGMTTAESEKQDKRKANRLLRRLSRAMLGQGEELLPVIREVSSVWAFDKDGKRYRRGAQSEDMRK